MEGKKIVKTEKLKKGDKIIYNLLSPWKLEMEKKIEGFLFDSEQGS